MLLVPPAIVQYPLDSVRSELEAMLEPDQMYRARIQIATTGPEGFSPEVSELMKQQSKLDQTNVAKLKRIVQQSGWPKKSVVGEAAAKAAFLVLQHGGFEIQKEFLPLYKSAAEAGEANLRYLAYLEDRVLVGEGKKQLYGTQVITRPGVNGPQVEPIEDEANVDERRAKMGLGTLAEYLKGFGIQYHKPTTPAPNPPLNSDPA